MSNPVKGEAQLGEFTIAFNFGAFCELEERTGLKMPQLLGALADGLGFGQLRDFVWAGLRQHHRAVGDEAILELLDQQGYEAAGSAVGKAVSGFFGPKAKEKNPPKAG